MPPVPLTDTVCINSTAASADERANRSTLLTSGKSTDRSTAECGTRNSQFVAMLLPEAAMTAPITSLGRDLRRKRSDRLKCKRQREQHQKYCNKPLDLSRCHPLVHSFPPLLETP